MTKAISLREARAGDLSAAYALFRRSIYDYLFRVGFVDEAAARNPPVESSWKRQGRWITHLWGTAAENWVAEGAGGGLVGWALSVLRDGHLELSMFFVEPGVQSGGIGRALLARAFPDGRARGKSIVATQDERALSLYLRSGVHHRTTSLDVKLVAGPVVPATDLVFERLAPGPEAISAIGALEREVLGFRRDEDIGFLLGMRPAFLARRGGRPAGYAFGIQPNPPDADDFEPTAGPMAALDPADIPALIDHVTREGPEGQGFFVTVPMANRVALDHLLRARGGRLDPFYLMILCSDDAARFDRYIHTSPSFIL